MSTLIKDIPEATYTKVTEEDLKHLIEILSPFSGYWKEIGVLIGFKAHELATIEGNIEFPDAVDFLSALLYKWVSSTSKSIPTLEALESALCSPILNLPDIAKELKQDLKRSKAGMLNSEKVLLQF